MSGVISIEGNLGAGKTSLLSLLNIKIIKEPVEQWQNVAGINLLNNYYENPKRWSFAFQLHALQSRIELWNQIIEKEPNQLHFSERSPAADRYIFGEIKHTEGSMDEAEYYIYNQICDSLMKTCPIKAIIYLKCSPEMCLQRMRKRNRKGEENISLYYLRKVHESHESWLAKMKSGLVLTIDTEVYDIYNPKDQKEVLKIMKDFIRNLGGKGQENFDLEVHGQPLVKVTVGSEA